MRLALTTVLLAFLLAVVGAVAFVVSQAREQQHLMVPLSLFESRTVSIAMVTGFAFMVGFYGLPFLFSLYFSRCATSRHSQRAWPSCP